MTTLALVLLLIAAALLIFGDARADGEPALPDYSRADWRFDSSRARAELRCASGEELDHIVALREAHGSGGAGLERSPQAGIRQRSVQLVVYPVAGQSRQVVAHAG